MPNRWEILRYEPRANPRSDEYCGHKLVPRAHGPNPEAVCVPSFLSDGLTVLINSKSHILVPEECIQYTEVTWRTAVARHGDDVRNGRRAVSASLVLESFLDSNRTIKEYGIRP